MVDKKKKDLIQKIILVLIFYSIIVALFNNTIILKLNEEIKKNKGITRELQQDYQIKLINFGDLEGVKKEYGELSKKVEGYKLHFIESKEKKYLIKKITEYGEANNIKFKMINFEEKKIKNRQEFHIDLRLETDYKNLLRYLEDLDIMQKTVEIRKMDIVKSNRILEVTIGLSAFMLSEKLEEEVAADE